MLIKNKADLTEHDVTPEHLYRGRRQFLQQAMAAGLIGAAFPFENSDAISGKQLKDVKRGVVTLNEKLTPYSYVTGYNNFYELGVGKAAPAKNTSEFKTRPWSVRVDGAVKRPKAYLFEDLIRGLALEERIYRLRCVEAWSMVVPWVGIPLNKIIRRLNPTSRAKYVVFETLHDPKRMPGQRGFVSPMPWPYTEGLRMDEAMHPLTILAVGLYGQALPGQNGAPLRLVVPWKYGFKSIKSIARIHFTDRRPETTWARMAPYEYGFYANVNPTVDHPRWSQARERRLGEDGLFTPKRKSLMFNGYAKEVAGLYRGMDLRLNF